MAPSLLDPRNDAAFDLPVVQGGRTFVVASSPRTGSTLLCRTLWDTGRVGAPKEYLNPMQIRDWEVRAGAIPSRWLHAALKGPAVALAGRGRWSDRRLKAHLERVRRRRTGPSGWFGLKLHFHHFDRWFLRARRAPTTYLGPITWVHVRREDRVAQAVSWALALQTGRWARHQEPWSTPVYSRGAIEGRLVAIDAAERGWRRWFAGEGLRPLEVTYRQICDLTGPARVLRHLGEPVLPMRLGLKAQGDALNAAWIQRYREGR